MNTKDFVIKITNKCDKQCPYCCESSCISGRMMNFKLFQSILNRVKKYTKNIGITGGEALLYRNQGKDFVDIINSLRKYNLCETVMTGGLNISNNYYYEHIFSRLDNIRFYLSISPINPDWYKRLLITLSLFKKYNHSLVGINLIEHPDWGVKEKRFYLTAFKRTMSAYDIKDEILKIFDCLPIGKGRQFLNRKLEKNCGCNIYPNNVIFIKESGLLYPCCAMFNHQWFHSVGWRKYYIKDIDKVIKKADKFCNNCKYRNK